jgi:hypothetical protein
MSDSIQIDSINLHSSLQQNNQGESTNSRVDDGNSKKPQHKVTCK